MRGKQSKHMSAQDYMTHIQALTTQPLTEATIRIRGNKQSGRQGINDIKERYELSHVNFFPEWPIIIMICIHKETLHTQNRRN